MVYENVRVPAENLLGGVEGKGFKIAMKALDGGRIGIAAQAVGIAQGALNEAVRYVKERIQFGRPIAAFQNTQFKLAEMQTMIDAARLLTYRAAVAKDNGQPYNVYAAMAKLTASDVANQVTRCLLYTSVVEYLRAARRRLSWAKGFSALRAAVWRTSARFCIRCASRSGEWTGSVWTEDVYKRQGYMQLHRDGQGENPCAAKCGKSTRVAAAYGKSDTGSKYRTERQPDIYVCGTAW